MKLYLGVSANNWYRFESHLADVDKVNFWQPVVKQRFSLKLVVSFKLRSPSSVERHVTFEAGHRSKAVR